VAPSLDAAIATPNRSPFTREVLRSIALIGTYVPRQCGIGTFTADLAHGLIVETQLSQELSRCTASSVGAQ
jgi:hypothetical protein